MEWAAARVGRVSEQVNITFINAQLSHGNLSSLRVQGSRISAVGVHAEAEDTVLDLGGDRLLPGLINAHDHLQLNHLPAHESPQYYQRSRDWISEIDLRRRSDPQFAAGVAVARNERLLLGGVKNLLSGVTTVAHHDPFYAFLAHSDFPVSVVRHYGWSHSLYIDGEDKVAFSCRSTPSKWPWIVHAAEGLDAAAADEFQRLDALGCIKSNTLLVHGIALDHSQRTRLQRAGAGLIWCPSSNLRLFGRTAEVRELIVHGRVALGTDSRLSGARDLLAELRLASKLSGLDEESLEGLVTNISADLLRLPDRGSLRPGLRADLLVLPASTPLACATRANVRMVMIDGTARYGDADYAPRASPQGEWANVQVDGIPKMLDLRIAKFLALAHAAETGLHMRPGGRCASEATQKRAL
jgi:cytosine/adenosine deaminase-related metal-dependent hydrolase